MLVITVFNAMGLVFAVVPKMTDFMALLGLTVAGFALSFMLVFSIATAGLGLEEARPAANRTDDIIDDIISVVTIGNTLDGHAVDEDVIQFGR